MAITDSNGIPVAIHTDSASPHEVTLVEKTLNNLFLDEVPEKIIGDKAYDSDKLDTKLALEWGIEMIAPNRKNTCKTQDGRPLRRYAKRWKVERLFAWLQNSRRLTVRYEYHIENYAAFIKVACIKILLKRIMG